MSKTISQTNARAMLWILEDVIDREILDCTSVFHSFSECIEECKECNCLQYEIRQLIAEVREEIPFRIRKNQERK